MNCVILFIAFFGTITQAWRWPWQKPDTPEWSELSVTFGTFSGLPLNENQAKAGGWKKTKSCGESNYFWGNRYLLNGDTAVMLLFDSNGKIAGIQNGMHKSAFEIVTGPWFSEDDMYVITAYFTNPRHICSGSRPNSEYLGDQLYLQTGLGEVRKIYFKEEDLAGTNWVSGGCFPAMGRHYWYNISADMSCDDFFPMFLVYNRYRLTGFGWAAQGNADSLRYEHPPYFLLKYGYFQSETMPKCITTIKALTTQHVYLDKRPYFNLCYI